MQEAIKSRPILFSGPMVRAILDGRKTQTRRIIKGVKPKEGNQPFDTWKGWSLDSGDRPGAFCPFGKPGDRLWVRETFCRSRNNVFYRCDGKNSNFKPNELSGEWDWDRGCGERWTPSIHMNRHWSRITLEITGLRVERLNEISEEDAKLEGVVFGTGKPGECRTCAKGAFMDLWNSINGVDSWLQNPWVWVVEFKVVTPC